MEFLFLLLAIPAIIITLGVILFVGLPTVCVVIVLLLPFLLGVGFILLLWLTVESISTVLVIIAGLIAVNLFFRTDMMKRYLDNH